MSYFDSKLVDQTFEEALEKVAEELKKEGFGILTEIDVQDTLKNKLDVDFRKYKILGACIPPLAHKALLAEPNIGVLLPCNIVVQETDDGKVEVSFVNPMESMQAVINDDMSEIAEEVSTKLAYVLQRL